MNPATAGWSGCTGHCGVDRCQSSADGWLQGRNSQRGHPVVQDFCHQLHPTPKRGHSGRSIPFVPLVVISLELIYSLNSSCFGVSVGSVETVPGVPHAYFAHPGKGLVRHRLSKSAVDVMVLLEDDFASLRGCFAPMP